MSQTKGIKWNLAGQPILGQVLSEKGARFKPYIEKYAIFDNLPHELLLEDKSLQLYDASATIDTIAARQDKVRVFLQTWKRQYIDAESHGLEGLSDAVEQIISDASENNITLNELNVVAGGSLKSWLRQAIKKASGE